MGPEIVVLEGSIVLAIKKICKFAVIVFSLYFLTIVFRSIKDENGQLIHYLLFKVCMERTNILFMLRAPALRLLLGESPASFAMRHAIIANENAMNGHQNFQGVTWILNTLANTRN